jgi:hypothetical protein
VCSRVPVDDQHCPIARVGGDMRQSTRSITAENIVSTSCRHERFYDEKGVCTRVCVCRLTVTQFIGERMIDQDMRNDEDQMMTLETHKQVKRVLE